MDQIFFKCCRNTKNEIIFQLKQMTILLKREDIQSDIEKQMKFPQHSTEVNPKMHPFCVV